MPTLAEIPALSTELDKAAPAVEATATLKAATTEAKKTKSKKAVVISALAVEIQGAATICGVVTKVFGSAERPSTVIKLPAWSEFQKSLPAGDEGTALAKCFLALRTAVETLAGDSASTWVIHTSGSFALYSKFTA